MTVVIECMTLIQIFLPACGPWIWYVAAHVDMQRFLHFWQVEVDFGVKGSTGVV